MTQTTQTAFHRPLLAAIPLLGCLFALGLPVLAATDLPGSLDAPALTWTTGGNANWFGQEVTSHDGVDAAQSGAILDDSESWAETTVIGPGILTFWWKVSSEEYFDYLKFYLDGYLEGSGISGEVNWQQRNVVINAGTHTVRWGYSKDSGYSEGDDAGWVDEVVFTPAPPFQYTIANGQVTITGYIGSDAAVTIPPTIEGLLVTAIGDGAFQLRDDIASVSIPASVTSIGVRAFQLCSNLTTISIPSTVTSIGVRAFYLCSKLSSVTISSGMTVLEEGLFANCSALGNVTIPSSITSIGSRAFSNCTSQTSMTIPSSVTSIGSWAFEECSGLTSVTIPDSVTSIDSGAFNDCTKLTSVTLPSSVTSIADYTFSACTGLTSVTIPASVTSIGLRAFEYCYKLPGVTIPASVSTIGNQAFTNCTLLTSATFLGNAPSMGSSVFANAAAGFTVYYIPGASGFTSPTWLGYPAVPGGVTTAPEITVEQPVGTALVDGASSVRFETASLGSPVVKTFTIRNDGDAALTGLALSKLGTDAANFILGSLGATSLAAGASTTFTVTCSPQTGATQTATLRIASNDANENPFDIALTARVVAINGDDFNDNSKNTAKWGEDRTFGTDGLIGETNGRLEYTSANTTGDHGSYRPWVLTQATYDSDWEVVMDVSNSISLPLDPQFRDTGIGVEIFPPGTNYNQSFFTEMNSSAWETGSFRGFVSGQGEDEFGDLDQESASAGVVGSIRIVYNSNTKVITTFCDTDGSANGYVWSPLATYGIAGSGGAFNADWNMSGSQVFQIAVYGFVDGSVVTSGQLYADNFSITTQSSGLPPSSPLQSWQILKFGNASAPEAALDFDADKDGLKNLLEYAFKLEPQVPGTPILTTLTGTSGLPRITPVGSGASQRLRLEYVRKKASSNPGITYTPQFSSTLQDGGTGGWSAITGPETIQSIDTEWERVVVEDTAGNGLPNRYGRVRVTAP